LSLEKASLFQRRSCNTERAQQYRGTGFEQISEEASAIVKDKNQGGYMSDYQPISKSQHLNLRWRRLPKYNFAENSVVAQLVLQELPKAILTRPVAFVESGDGFMPAAVQGLEPGQNLFVNKEGRWRGGYLPATYRGYPFALARAEDGQRVLCGDMEGEHLGENTEGEALFDEQGEPSKGIQEVLDFLVKLQDDRARTEQICAVLQRNRLIKPWIIEVRRESDVLNIEGLFCIDETALNSLPMPALEEVRKAGGLPIAYMQLLSMQHMQGLAMAAQSQAEATGPEATSLPVTLDFDSLNDSGNIQFGNL